MTHYCFTLVKQPGLKAFVRFSTSPQNLPPPSLSIGTGVSIETTGGGIHQNKQCHFRAFHETQHLVRVCGCRFLHVLYPGTVCSPDSWVVLGKQQQCLVWSGTTNMHAFTEI